MQRKCVGGVRCAGGGGIAGGVVVVGVVFATAVAAAERAGKGLGGIFLLGGVLLAGADACVLLGCLLVEYLIPRLGVMRKNGCLCGREAMLESMNGMVSPEWL
jgi:hypothetical protein